jgi:hypothetical protein
VRQILTLRENEHLSFLQAQAMLKIEEQAQHIAEHNIELEEGIAHLKAVQTSLANGNARTRAHLKQGMLWSLATSLNLLAERQESLMQDKKHLEQVRRALVDLGMAVEFYRAGKAFKLPASCTGLPEIMPVLHAIGLLKSAQSAPTRPEATPIINAHRKFF